MRTHLSPMTQAALLLSALAMLIAATTRTPQQDAPTAAQSHPPMATLAATGRMALRQCREHAAIIYDVHWAAACLGNPSDDSPECHLPDERAAPLNLERERAEERCVEEARAADRPAAHAARRHQ
jgi:hypothetical protein